MKLMELTEFLVKSLVSDPEMVSVKAFDGEENQIIIEVLVAEKDMGPVIGSSGRTANAIRTIVQAASYINENKQVRININSF